MKKRIRVIDPQDDLHAAVERSVEGLSPAERSAKLREMFGGKKKPPAPEPDEPETEKDGIRAEAIRRERLRRLADPQG